MHTLRTWAAVVGLVALTGAAQAALVVRGGGLIYDSTRNITWLADMNHAKTSGYDSGGLMTWAAARQWADDLVYGGFSDWRLPALDPSDASCSAHISPADGSPGEYFGNNCTGGELSSLFVTDLGNQGDQSVLNQAGDTAQQIANLIRFSNVQSDVYWSGTNTRRLRMARGTSAPTVAVSTTATRAVPCMPWRCAPAMWWPLCPSHNRWRWPCWGRA